MDAHNKPAWRDQAFATHTHLAHVLASVIGILVVVKHGETFCLLTCSLRLRGHLDMGALTIYSHWG